MLLENLNRYFTRHLWHLTNMDKSLWNFWMKGAAKSSPKLPLHDVQRQLSWQSSLNAAPLSWEIICKNVVTPNVGELPAHHHPISVTEQWPGDKLLLVQHLDLLGGELGNSPLTISGFIPRALCWTGGMGHCPHSGSSKHQHMWAAPSKAALKTLFRFHN